jgi:hypothetical protein
MRWIDEHIKGIITVLIILICCFTTATVVFVATTIRMNNRTIEEIGSKQQVVDEDNINTEQEEVIEETEPKVIENDNIEEPEIVQEEVEQTDDGFVVMGNCMYCRKEIASDDDNMICEECEYESWSWHCTWCDAALTQEEYDNDSGVCFSCQEQHDELVSNSPYGICDLCGQSIPESSYNKFLENNQDFCSRICQDKFFNRTAPYGYCESCTKQLSYSEQYLFKTKCEVCVNKNK